MPVRFLCTECHKLLSVGTRKIGSQVKCPRCQAAITVPAPEEAAALMARTSLATSRDPENQVEFVGFDDMMAEFPVPTLTAPVSEKVAAAPEAADPGLVAFPRWMLFAQAVLLGVVALLAFGLGYVSGRLSRPVSPVAPGDRASAEAPLNS